MNPQYFTNSEIELIARKELSILAELSNQKTKVINIMMHSDHYEKNQIKEIELKKNFVNFDINWYRENINYKLTNVFNNGKIELDGHYNEEANEIIASEIANLINAFERLSDH